MIIEFLYSVEDVFIFWLISMGMLAVLLYRSLAGLRRWASLRVFLANEDGASYALPYLMTFPFYLLTVCLVIQTSIILITKIGVMHAAHAAARSAVVWKPFEEEGLVEQGLTAEKSRNAAVLAITPFASGQKAHELLWQKNFSALHRVPEALIDGFSYASLYKQLAQHSEAKDSPQNLAYVRRKFVLASAMTEVKIESEETVFNAPLHAEVSFRMPILVPGTGRLLGKMHSTEKGYYRDVRARATLPLETPISNSQTLGIDYDPSRV